MDVRRGIKQPREQNKKRRTCSVRQERLFLTFYVWLTFPGEESGQKLAQAVPAVCAILSLVVVGELP